jgi:uncharacterized protein YigE (DUF2233 family)
MIRILTFATALLLTLAGIGTASADCEKQTFEDGGYVVCRFDPAQDDLRLFWQADGAPFRTFDALAAALKGEGKTLAFAMNAGMYDDALRPVGLYVEDDKTLVPLNTKTVTGTPAQIPNFYKKPNGVFYFGGGKAGIATTESFVKDAPDTRFATQSGPMLLIDGAIHPAFIDGSTDRKPRDGVGILGDGAIVFAISDGAVNFYDFARFFRDGLGVKDALFLDGGSAPGLYAPELGRDDAPGHGGYGPIVAVVR